MSAEESPRSKQDIAKAAAHYQSIMAVPKGFNVSNQMRLVIRTDHLHIKLAYIWGLEWGRAAPCKR